MRAQQDPREGNPTQSSVLNQEDEENEDEEFHSQMLNLAQQYEDDGSYDQGNGEFQYRIEDHDGEVSGRSVE